MNIFKCLQFRNGECSGNLHYEQSFIHNISSNASILQRFSIEEKLCAHSDSVNTICFDETGNKLVSGCNNGKVFVWDLSKANSLKLQREFDFGSTTSIYTTNFMPKSDSDIILSGGDDRKISLSRVSSNSCFKQFNCHRSSVWKVEVEKNNPYTFLSASEDSTVRFFDLRENHQCGSFDTRCQNVLVDLKKEDKRLYNGNGISITTFSTLHIEIYSLALNPVNSNYFVIGGNDPVVRLFDRRMLSTSSTNPNKSSPVHKWIPVDILTQSRENTNAHYITGLNWNHDGSKIAVSYSGNQIFILDSKISKIENALRKNTKKKRKNHTDEQEFQSMKCKIKKEEEKTENRDENETISNSNDFTTYYNNHNDSSNYENSIRGRVHSQRLRTSTNENTSHSRQTRYSDHSLNLSPENLRPLIYSSIYSSPLQLRRMNNTEGNTTPSNEPLNEPERNLTQNSNELNHNQNLISIGRWLNMSRRREFMDSDLKVLSVCKGYKNIEGVCKNVAFYGSESEYVISGSDDGTIFIWDIRTKDSKIVNILTSDDKKLISCVIVHPCWSKILSSGSSEDIKIWSPILSEPDKKSKETIETIVKKNEDDIKEHMEIRSRLPRVMVNIIQLIWPTQ